jgi:hypothetical protein
VILASTLCTVAVAAVGLRALPRPAAEYIVDVLYALAQRAYAAAVAADRGLVAYRMTKRQAIRDTVMEYERLAANSAPNWTAAAGAAETTGAADASGCPEMGVV